MIVDDLDDEADGDENSEARVQRKRQRILQLATQLACEPDEGAPEKREALVQLLARETRLLEPSSSGETWAWRPNPDGVKTEGLQPPLQPPSDLDLHSHLEELLRPPLASTNGRCTTPSAASAAPGSGSGSGSSKGLRLDLRLVDGGEVRAPLVPAPRPARGCAPLAPLPPPRLPGAPASAAASSLARSRTCRSRIWTASSTAQSSLRRAWDSRPPRTGPRTRPAAPRIGSPPTLRAPPPPRRPAPVRRASHRCSRRRGRSWARLSSTLSEPPAPRGCDRRCISPHVPMSSSERRRRV